MFIGSKLKLVMFGFNIWQIAFAAIAFPVLAVIGTFQLRQFEQRDFQPRNIEQRAIDQRQLSAARDLKGTWQGTARYDFTGIPSRCSDFMTWELVLNITSQTDNAIGGRATYTLVNSEGVGNIRCNPAQVNTYDVTGTINASKITIDESAAAGNSYTGSFTSDTITLNESGGASRLTAPINLLRQ